MSTHEIADPHKRNSRDRKCVKTRFTEPNISVLYEISPYIDSLH